ncbi:MAG TPA: tRNA (N(6)-L-threonylcarbamoyladenosine(37)-C(2))-methylthiotransferase MtaB, partial [Candidatus Cloacimonadota bacterium]|nr:tRNA (N(6)-L-threonylcarbamoyladenosine(37)-C(2))-methylthiotransferase MtaB [Candidatus Cloacimonadota bacterium]
MKRVAIVTLGCKTNQAESAAILGGLESRSYLSVDFNEPADLYIINTCTVTNRTDYKSRYYIRKALEQKKLRTDVKIVVTGCYSQRSREEVMSLGDVDLVIDNQTKLDIPKLLDGAEHSFMDIMQATDFHYVPQQGMGERSRAFQKIQDG